MSDFSHLQALHVTDESEAEYTFDHPLTGEPVASIWFAPMSEENPAYMSERARMAVERATELAKMSKADRKKKVVSVDQLEEDRDMDRVLLARTCAKRWGLVPKLTDGTDAEFSEDVVLEFLRALPAYMVDPCRGFVGNVYNFIKRPAVTEGAGEALGNS